MAMEYVCNWSLYPCPHPHGWRLQTSCTDATDANVLDAVQFPSAGPFAIACPASLPITCLDEVFDAHVLTFVAAPAPVSAEIDVPEAPTVAEEIVDSSYAARGMQVGLGGRSRLSLHMPQLVLRLILGHAP